MADDFNDPFSPPADGTVLRPRPGGIRRGADAAQSPSARSAPYQSPPGSPPPPGSPFPGNSSAGNPSPGNLSVEDFLVGGYNPILEAAAPLLTIASRLQWSVAQADIGALRQQATREMRSFDDRLRSAGVSQEDALVARYLLCTFFDSAVQNTPWGAQSDWSAQSLLIMFHKEGSGGEKFFQILERLQGQPGRYIDLLEMQYVCLALGYEGMYRIDNRGAAKLAEIQHGLQRIIRDTRQLRDEELSIHWRGVEDRRNPIFRYVPWWIVAAAGAAILVVAFVIYNVRLNAAAERVKFVLSQPSVKVDYSTPAEPVKQVNRLKQLLAPEERAGQLKVEEFGNQTLVTLVASNLFRSGSAQVSPEYRQTLQAIAAALNEVKGKVSIIGHTDDQPLRSLQFADNFELSRERAVSVANVLKETLTNFGRVEWTGVGATQPRYEPVNTAENRARNRRVEIICVEEGSP